MATITVTNLYDSGAGSLRQAILDANSGDTINFDPTLAGGTLVLTSGELDIIKNLTIDGFTNADGTPNLTISGGTISRIFDVQSGTGSGLITATLNGLVLENGYVAGDIGGAVAVGSYDAVTVSNSRLVDNQAVYKAGPGGGNGGAISVTGLKSTLTILTTTIYNNSAQNEGGGIYSNFANVNVVNSTLSGNSARDGGGVFNTEGSTLTTVNATLSGNRANDDGGAIWNSLSSADLYDSTLTGNLGTAGVGAIENFGGSLRLSNSIVTGNNGQETDDISGDLGTRIYFKGNNIVGSLPTVTNGALINKNYGTYTQIDGRNATALQTVFTSVGNDPNTNVVSGVLADNGGAVQTVLINPSGVAYNAGSNAALPPNTFDLDNSGNTTEPLPLDARGVTRVVGGTVDIGAVEQQGSYVVTTLADNPYDGKNLAGELAEGNGLSLRQALGLANASGGPSTITFAANLAGGTIHLANGELDIASNVTIDGPTNVNGTPDLTIDAGYASRAFDVADGTLASPITATLEGLLIVDGRAGAANGGGIAVGQYDALTLSNSRLANNTAGFYGAPSGGEGGAVYVGNKSSLTLLNTTIDHNAAQVEGGGIYAAADAAITLVNTTVSSNDSQSAEGGGIDLGVGTSGTLINATVVGNSSSTNGGGIYGANSNIIKLYNSTITGNYGTGTGGGIDSGGSNDNVILANSIVAGNSVSTRPGNDLYLGGSPLVLKGTNILGSAPADAGSIDKSNGTYTPIDGTNLSALATVFARVATNPNTGVLSGVLANNGGAVRTVAINPAGIAYNAGSNTALPPDTFDLNNNGNTAEPLPVDARGYSRAVGGTVDIGAFEQQQPTNFVVTTLADNPYDGGTLAQELAEGHGLSLRQAIGLANADPTTADSIQFDPSLIGGTTHGVNDGVLLLTNGELKIDSNVTIQGDVNFDGKPDITVDGQGASRDFLITGGNVLLDGLTITGGYAFGRGGGVLLGMGGNGPANVFIYHSVITNNQAGYGGGIYVDSGDALSLSNSVISGDYAFLVGGGIANEGALAMRDTTVSGDSSGFIGGGIANAGAFFAVNATLSNNQVIGAASGSGGGGLYNAGIAALANTTIAGNKGGYAGGGIYNNELLQLTNVTIANNSAYNGGGLYNARCGCGNVAIYNSTFTGNNADQFGGGIYNANGAVALTNTLVAGNRAGYQGPDIQNGLGITNYYGVNLFSQSGVGRPGTDITQSDLTRVFASLTTVDPDFTPNSGDEFQAGTLANNGGPVETVAIRLGGSAQDTGSTADLPPDFFDLNSNGDTSEPLPVDARGEPRVFGKAVDIGAFEVQRLPETVPFDLNGDANSDLVFQDNGQPGIWLMNGATPIAEAGLANPGASWHIITSRDLNGDGNSDLIWQNSDGTPGIWLMNTTTPIAEVGLTNPGVSWHIVASGDLNGDGNADLVWQNTDGTLGVWLMNGIMPTAQAGIGNPGSNWKVVGTADFNADGNDDILLQNSATGNLMIDLMNATSIASTVSITVGDPSWHAVSTGEFNGQAEIAWQNNNGMVGVWLMNGTSPVAEAALPGPGAGWQLVSIDHFTPNGQADLLFQNTSGPLLLWEMNGTSVAAMVNPPNPTAAWQSVNGHPFAAG